MKAAVEFTNKYLPELDLNSVYFPDKIVDFLLPTQCPIPITEDTNSNNDHKERLKIPFTEDTNFNNDHKERLKMLGLKKKFKGNSAEIDVFKFIQISLKSKLCALFLSVNQMNMFVLTGDTALPEPKNSEFDIVCILPEYYKIIIVEVKSHKKYNAALLKPKILEQVEKGRRFCKWMKMYACEDKLEEFQYIPVLALPNIKKRSEVKLKDVIVISSEEMKKNFLGVLMEAKDSHMTKRTSSDLKDYRTIVQLMFSSCHAARVAKLEGGFGFFLAQPELPVNRTHKILIGEGAETISAGFNSQDDLKLPVGLVRLSDLKNKPLGSLESIIFWNPTQLSVVKSYETKKIIIGDYGTGKTLLLMAQILRFRKSGKKVVFVVDADHASDIFQVKMKLFCKENGVTFFNKLHVIWDGMMLADNTGYVGKMSHGFDDKIFRKYLHQNRDHCFVIDELSAIKIKTLFSEEFSDMTFVCSIHPSEVSGLKDVPGDWKLEKLSNVMRNSSNIFSLACHSASLLQNPISSVIGPKPKLICIVGISDLMIGLKAAIENIEDDKFVLLFDDSESSVDKPSDCWATDNPIYDTASGEIYNRRLARAKNSVGKHMNRVASVWKTEIQNKIKNVDLYHNGYDAHEDVIFNFLKSEKGCLMTPRFEGMESKSLIYVTGTRVKHFNMFGDTFPILRKDLTSRATVNLVIIHDMISRRKVFNKDLCDIVNPYKKGSKKNYRVVYELQTINSYPEVKRRSEREENDNEWEEWETVSESGTDSE